MSKLKDESTTQPRPWKKVHTFDDFNSADKKRNDLLKNKDLSVKVKRMSNGTFVVKVRPINSPAKKSSKKNKSKG